MEIFNLKNCKKWKQTLDDKNQIMRKLKKKQLQRKPTVTQKINSYTENQQLQQKLSVKPTVREKTNN